MFSDYENQQGKDNYRVEDANFTPKGNSFPDGIVLTLVYAQCECVCVSNESEYVWQTRASRIVIHHSSLAHQ